MKREDIWKMAESVCSLERVAPVNATTHLAMEVMRLLTERDKEIHDDIGLGIEDDFLNSEEGLREHRESVQHGFDTRDIAESNGGRFTTIYIYTSPRTAVRNGVQHGWHGVDVGLYDLSPDLRELLAGLVDDKARLHYDGEPIDMAYATLADLREKLTDMRCQEEAERAARTAEQKEDERLAELRRVYVTRMMTCPAEELICQDEDGDWWPKKLPVDLFGGCGLSIATELGRTAEADDAIREKKQAEIRVSTAERGKWLISLGYAEDGDVPYDILRNVIIREMLKALGALGEGWTSTDGVFEFSHRPPSTLTPDQSAAVEALLGRDDRDQLAEHRTVAFAGLPAVVHLRVVMFNRSRLTASTPCILAKMPWHGTLWLVMKAL